MYKDFPENPSNIYVNNICLVFEFKQNDMLILVFVTMIAHYYWKHGLCQTVLDEQITLQQLEFLVSLSFFKFSEACFIEINNAKIWQLSL